MNIKCYLFVTLSVLSNLYFGQTDACPTATNIVSNGACTNVAYTVPGSFANTGLVTASCTVGGMDDGWFRFTATSANTQISANALGNSVVLALFSGGCGTTQIQCVAIAAGASGTITATTIIGTTYYIQIHRTSGNTTASVSGNICISTPPANDNCAMATVFGAIPTNGNSVCINNQTTVNATNSNVTPTGSCSSNTGNPDDDIWFRFTATASQHQLTATNDLGDIDVYWQVFSGVCGASMASIACSDNNAGMLISGLTVGQTYYLRMYTVNTATITQYDLCLSTPPINDECINAISLTVQTSLSACGTLGTLGTLAGATSSSEANTCVTGTDNDVWYTFTASQPNLAVITTPTNSIFNIVHSVYSGGTSQCGAALSSPIYCVNNPDYYYSVYNNFIVGNTYLVRVYTPGTGTTNNFRACVYEVPPAPLNDDCNSAQLLTPSPTSSCSILTPGATSAGSFSQMAGCTSPSYPDDDVWYSFAATNTEHHITITNTVLATEVYQGSCTGLTSVSCRDNYMENLTIGSVYFVRVYNPNRGLSSNSFSICITTPPNCNPLLAPPNDNCGTATLVNSFDGYCGTTLSSYTTDQFTSFCAGSGGASVENNSWLAFDAASSTVNMQWWVKGGALCTAGNGVQFAIFQGTCGSLTEINNTCVRISGGPGSTGAFSASGLTPGQRYYVMIDGYNGQICDYVFQAQSGIAIGSLPIELIDMTIEQTENNIIKITWLTATEINNDYYEIQKSYNAIDWQTINRTNSTGNSYTTKEYSSIDILDNWEDRYYRLIQTDFSGEQKTFEPKFISPKNKTTSLVYNPTQQSITLHSNDKISSLEIYNLMGQSLINSTSIKNIDVSSLPCGIYLIKFNGSFVNDLKFVKY